MLVNEDDDVLEIDVEDLFKDPEETEETETTKETKETTESSPETKAVAKRISEVKSKTETEVQERVAKEAGFESYAAMKAAQEKKIMADAGLDEDDVEAVVSKLVEKRLADDPRMKKLTAYEEREKQQFVKTQLSEINKLTGQNFTSLDQLPPETLSLWEKTGNLKQAYLATQGEELIIKGIKQSEKGTLTHLANSGSNTGIKTRALTEEEKDIWRAIMPDITEEELSKKTTKI